MALVYSASGLIHPFNMPDPKSRSVMFGSSPPNEATMLIYLVGDTCIPAHEDVKTREARTLIHWLDCDVSDLAMIHGPLVEECIKKSRFPRLRFEMIAVDSYDEVFASLEWVPLNQVQRQWSLDNQIKLQVGFLDSHQAGSPPDPISAIYAAMTVSDRIYTESGIIIPKDQPATIVDTTFEHAYRVFVNGTFKDNIGVWCRELAELRNEVMVKIRASLRGQDPDAEWNKFRDAGMIHFLDYLTLCP